MIYNSESEEKRYPYVAKIRHVFCSFCRNIDNLLQILTIQIAISKHFSDAMTRSHSNPSSNPISHAIIRSHHKIPFSSHFHPIFMPFSCHDPIKNPSRNPQRCNRGFGVVSPCAPPRAASPSSWRRRHGPTISGL